MTRNHYNDRKRKRTVLLQP